MQVKQKENNKKGIFVNQGGILWNYAIFIGGWAIGFYNGGFGGIDVFALALILSVVLVIAFKLSRVGR